jgi:hypothetical protein
MAKHALARRRPRRHRRRRNPTMQDLLPVGIGVFMGGLITYFYLTNLPKTTA